MIALADAEAVAITPSTVIRERIAGQSNALSSGLGRARPEVSIRIWSGRGSRASNVSTVGMKSSATVQQMQPLASSTTFSAGQSGIAQPFRMSPSTPSVPNSLTTTASRRPLALRIRWLISVVLPAPRKPVTMVTGILASCGSATDVPSRAPRRREHGGAAYGRCASDGRAPRMSPAPRTDAAPPHGSSSLRRNTVPGHPLDPSKSDLIAGRFPGSRVMVRGTAFPDRANPCQWPPSRRGKACVRHSPLTVAGTAAALGPKPRTAFPFTPPCEGHRRDHGTGYRRRPAT